LRFDKVYASVRPRVSEVLGLFIVLGLALYNLPPRRVIGWFVWIAWAGYDTFKVLAHLRNFGPISLDSGAEELLLATTRRRIPWKSVQKGTIEDTQLVIEDTWGRWRFEFNSEEALQNFIASTPSSVQSAVIAPQGK